MTVRIKILAISVVLLVLFAIVLVSSVIMQGRSSDKVATLLDFHLPIADAIADLDVATFEYELTIERLLRPTRPTPAEHEANLRAFEKSKVRIAKDFDTAARLLTRAVADPRTDVGERLVLARVQRSFEYMRRLEEPFIAVGDQVLAAHSAGRDDEARDRARGFEKFEQAFGPDLAGLRGELDTLARASTLATHEQQARVLRLNVVLFVIAVVLGLALSAAGAKRLVQALWRVVEGAKAIEAGNLAARVPVTSRDEIGQLAEAFNRMAEELGTKERIKDTFGKYVDPRIVARLIDTSKENIEQAERRVATILFSDLKNFTTMSEQLTATSMVRLLNRYFTVVADQIRAHNGILEKYIGDAVMAFWAPPFSPGDEHAASACLAALALAEAVAAMRPELPQLIGLRRNVPELTVRIGLATGEVVVGTIGAPTAQSFAAIGDITNLASRLEGVNKVYRTTVIATEDTYRLAQQSIEARELDTIVVAGKSEPVRIFEVLGRAGATDAKRLELRDGYAEGLAAYRRQDWIAAERRFGECLKIHPDDGPAGVLRDRTLAFMAAPPSPGWDAVWHLTEK